LNKAKGYIVEALQWMIDDGLAASIDVMTEWTKPNMLGAQVTLNQSAGKPIILDYSWAWSELS
jgi:phage gp46-like protein